MTFHCKSTTGRRCQAEETEEDLQRIYDGESDKLIRAHLLKAGDSLATATALLRAKERDEKSDA